MLNKYKKGKGFHTIVIKVTDPPSVIVSHSHSGINGMALLPL
jgi:hypothetical protein